MNAASVYSLLKLFGVTFNSQINASIESALGGQNSSCRVYGGEITDAASQKINISAGAGFIKNVSAAINQIPTGDGVGQASDRTAVTWSDVTGMVTPVGMCVVFYDASAGAIVVIPSVNFEAAFNFNRDFIIGKVFNDGTNLTIFNSGNDDWNIHKKEQSFISDKFTLERSRGLVISGSTRFLLMTEGNIWIDGNVRKFIASKNTSTGSVFTTWYRDGSGGWIKTENQTEVDNQKFDNGTGTLADIAIGRFSNRWVYLDINGNLHVVYGISNTSLSTVLGVIALATLPDYLINCAIFLGRILVEKDAISLRVQSIFSNVYGHINSDEVSISKTVTNPTSVLSTLTNSIRMNVTTTGTYYAFCQRLGAYGSVGGICDIPQGVSQHGYVMGCDNTVIRSIDTDAGYLNELYLHRFDAGHGPNGGATRVTANLYMAQYRLYVGVGAIGYARALSFETPLYNTGTCAKYSCLIFKDQKASSVGTSILFEADNQSAGGYVFKTGLGIHEFGDSATFAGSVTRQGNYEILDQYSVPPATFTKIRINKAGSLALVQGIVYKICLNTANTSVLTGSNYIVYYASGVWNIKLVSRAGSIENHPLMRINGNNLEIFHNDPSEYLIQVNLSAMSVVNTTAVNKLIFGLEGAITVDVDKIDFEFPLRMGGNQIITTRQANVANAASANATDLASAITLVNELKTQLNVALTMLRTHGLHG